jgi:hypothetical protein
MDIADLLLKNNMDICGKNPQHLTFGEAVRNRLLIGFVAICRMLGISNPM